MSEIMTFIPVICNSLLENQHIFFIYCQKLSEKIEHITLTFCQAIFDNIRIIKKKTDYIYLDLSAASRSSQGVQYLNNLTH